MARRRCSESQENWGVERQEAGEVGRDFIMHGPVGLHLVIGQQPGFCRPWI